MRSSAANCFVRSSEPKNLLEARPVDLDTAQADIDHQGNQRHLKFADPDQVNAFGTVAMFIRRINQLRLEGLPETVEVGDIIATVFELVPVRDISPKSSC